MQLDPGLGRALEYGRMVNKWLRPFGRTHSPSVLIIPAMHHRPFPTPRGPIILLWACPRLTTAMRTLIANHLSAAEICRIPTPRAIHHHPNNNNNNSACHHRRVLRTAETASAHHLHNTPPARIPISLPYPHHSYIHSLRHSLIPPCLLKGAAQDTPPSAYRPTDRVHVPRRSSLAQDQEGQEGRADLGDACRRARRVDLALGPLACHPGSPLGLGLVPSLVSTTGR